MSRRWRRSCATPINERDACSAAENNKVGVNQSLFRFLLLLFLAFRHDQLLTAQRRQIDNESTGLYKTGYIEVHGIADGCVRVAHYQLAWANQNRIAKMPGPVQSACAFQHQKFTNAGVIFDHGGCPRDRRRGAARMNLHLICALRGLNQDRSFTQAFDEPFEFLLHPRILSSLSPLDRTQQWAHVRLH